MALAEAGLPDQPADDVVEFSSQASIAALATPLALPEPAEPPTAVVLGGGTRGMGVLEGSHRHGRRVPDDLAVVDYNDIELAEYLGATTCGC